MRSTMSNIFRALRYKNYRIFFMGQGVSLVGTWMQQIAMGWLVYRLTNSAFALGLVWFSSQIPAFLLGPFAGVMADRWDRRRTIIVTQFLSMVQAFVLAVLTLTGAIQVWHIVILGIFLGCVNSLDMPTRQSFIVEMVEGKDNLSNAIALNSLMFNAARLVGPSIAGVVIAIVGEGICFLINGVSFIAVIISLAAMKINTLKRKHENFYILERLREGFVYVFGHAPIRMILALLGIISLMGSSYLVLMPVFAKDILRGGPETLGLLMASAGIGALTATVYIASRKNVSWLMRMIPAASLIFAAGLIVFSLSCALWFSLLALILAGFGLMAHMSAANIIIQTMVDDDKRGRVMSFYTMAIIGTAPLGSLLAGTLASRIGPTWTLMAGGVCCIIASIAFVKKLPLLKF